ncbi:biotin/lipoyl-binding protein [Fundidesulfovibrio soli]|uniref:biotin/lipoyl-binding protein n=1 Tax=Fundidesulfovibrio soli TaxID=2922716 RepID=UPI001FB03448|nr:biotin/lipoyl-binding protein [Fundidesulfovibrio soli]
MSQAAAKSGKLTVFKTDRHEDFGAICFAVLVAASVMIYMAFFLDKVTIKAPADGKLVEMKVAMGDTIKEGQPLYTYETVKKKFVEGKLEESKATETFKSKTPGKVLELKKKPGDAFKKGNGLLVVEHVKGTLP